jgi:hypothetical protein
MWELWIDENGDLQVDAPLSEEDKVEEFIAGIARCSRTRS